jgi:hypothetical protein
MVGATSAIAIDSSRRVGIGTTSPSSPLSVVSDSGALGVAVNGRSSDNLSQVNFYANNGTSLYGRIQNSSTATLIGSTSELTFGTGGSLTERARIDSSGRLLVGTSTSVSTGNGYTPGLQVAAQSGSISASSYRSDEYGGIIALQKSKSATVGTQTIVSNNDQLGLLSFEGSDGTNFEVAAQIQAYVDGTPGSNDMPGRLVFSTTADAAASPTERLRINSSGQIAVAGAGSAAAPVITKGDDLNTGIFFPAADTIAFAEGGSEAARIDSSGRLLVGTSTVESGNERFVVKGDPNGDYLASFVATSPSTAPFGLWIKYSAVSPNNTSARFLDCADSTTTRLEIRSNGGIANYSANNVNLSDYNAKKDIAPAAGTWDCLKEWEIVNFRYKDQPDDADLNMGVIAQQVAESCPEVITAFQEATEDQPEKLGVKDQQMMWMAIKALQEAQLRIETLEAKVAALEGV